MAYQVLIEQGYDRNDVFIFDSEGGTPFFSKYRRDHACIAVASVRLSRARRRATRFTLGLRDGTRAPVAADEESKGEAQRLGVSTIVLNPGEEAQDEFVTWLEAVPVGVGIAFFDQCYFGQIRAQSFATGSR